MTGFKNPFAVENSDFAQGISQNGSMESYLYTYRHSVK